MTRAEWLGALREGQLLTGWRLQHLSFWRKIQLVFLKVVAISAYYYGKSKGQRRSLDVADSRQRADTGSTLTSTKRLETPDLGAMVAVVLPFYIHSNQQLAQLMAAVWSLHIQTRPADLLVLVDDGSPMPLPPNLGNTEVQILRLAHNKGPAAARNCGLARARDHGAHIVCFMDADCEPADDWVSNMVSAQRASPGIISGNTFSACSSTTVGIFHDLYGTLNGRVNKGGSMLYGCTCNLSIAAAAVPLEFDETFRAAAFEDVEFCVRARKLGASIKYRGGAVMRHNYSPGVHGVFRQFERYGRAEAQMSAKHSEYLAGLYGSRDVSCLLDAPAIFTHEPAPFLRFPLRALCAPARA